MVGGTRTIRVLTIAKSFGIGRPEVVRVGRRRDGGIAEARRERRQDEIPVEHVEIGVGREAVRFPQSSQRLENEADRDERTTPDAKHGGIE